VPGGRGTTLDGEFPHAPDGRTSSDETGRRPGVRADRTERTQRRAGGRQAGPAARSPSPSPSRAASPQIGWAQGADDEAGTQEPRPPAGEERAPEEPAPDEPDADAFEGGSAEPPPGYEVLRIRGQGLSALETEVPTSVTQFDAAAIQALGAQNVADLAKVTPNVEIRTSGATTATFFIRGVGLSDFNANAPSAVAIYQDDVALNLPALQLGQFFDLQDVQVLRGPQAWGRGRNASGGAIRMVSAKPTGRLESNLRSTVGRYDFRDFEGALETPILQDSLAARLAFRFSERDPFGKNRCANAVGPRPNREPVAPGAPAPPQPDGIEVRLPPPSVAGQRPELNGPVFCGESLVGIPNPRDPNRTDPVQPDNVFVSDVPSGLPDEVNDRGLWAARAQLRFQPQDTEMDWLLNGHGSRLDQLSTLGQTFGTNGRRINPDGPNFEGLLGASDRQGYTDPDVVELRTLLRSKLAARFPTIPNQELTRLTQLALQDELAEHLDLRPYHGDYNTVGDTTLDTWGTFLRGDVRFGDVDFTTITAYDAYDRFRHTDQDFTPNIVFENVTEDEAWQVYQDFQLSGALADTAVQWRAGAYAHYQDLDVEVTNDFGGNPGAAFRQYTEKTVSYALYGGLTWDLFDDFTVEGGVRWNWERKELDYFLINIGVELTDEPSNVWEAPTGSLALTYRLTDRVALSWKYARGWKSGHYNGTSSNIRGVTVAEPEEIDSFEVALKGSWFDDRVSLGASLFYYIYENYQVFVVADDFSSQPQIEVINANDAEVYGSEIDLKIEPLDGLLLTARVGWLESQFLDFTQEVPVSVLNFGPPPRTDTFSVTRDYSGNRLINSPRWKVSLGAEYTIGLGRYGSLIPRYDGAWSDDVFFDPTQGRGVPNSMGERYKPRCTIAQCAFWLHNVRLGYRTPEGNIEIGGWVRNLTDEQYKTYAFDASTFAQTVIVFTGEPRMFGLDLTVRF
jgi:outer membrane receptor protein involved in Fe transport